MLFTISDASGSVVRHIKRPAGKGLQRFTWDMRYAPANPVTQRYTPAPDQLFGAAPQGHLVMPGEYQVTLSKYHDGVLTKMAGPVSFKAALPVSYTHLVGII